jgi:hypothetical protein
MTTTPVPVRLSTDDRAALREVASRLQKNQSETLRLLIRGMHAVLKEQDRKAKRNNQANKQPAS